MITYEYLLYVYVEYIARVDILFINTFVCVFSSLPSASRNVLRLLHCPLDEIKKYNFL